MGKVNRKEGRGRQEKWEDIHGRNNERSQGREEVEVKARGREEEWKWSGREVGRNEREKESTELDRGQREIRGGNEKGRG